MSFKIELCLLFIAACSVLITMLTLIVQMAPWDHLDWRLLAISTMSMLTSLLTLWIAMTVT